MRDIRFRAWHKENNEMLYPSDFRDSAHPRSEALARFPDEDCMQYTGLLDKDGVEIYEGDIIARHSKYGEREFGFVEYNGCSFNLNRQSYIKIHGGAQWLDCPEEAFENDEFQWCEVTGNIWEHNLDGTRKT